MSGLRMSDIDGLFTANMVNILPTLAVGEYLGIKPKVAVGTNTGGNSFVDHVLWASLALQAGLCNVALICYGSNARTATVQSPPDAPPYEAIYKPREPLVSYALAAARHMHDYGTTREQLASVAVSARQWAMKNPIAFARDDLTIADVLKSRMICDPLSLLDCCLVTDGAGAIIMTRAERRQGHQESAGLSALAAPRRKAIARSARCLTCRRRLRPNPARAPSPWRSSRRRTSTCFSSTTPSPSTSSCSWRTSASARRARVAHWSPPAPSRPAATCRSTPMAAA